MSLDRRVVSILQYNGIDVNEVEEFLGVKNNCYEIIMKGEKTQLKIPENADCFVVDEPRKIKKHKKVEIENVPEKIPELITEKVIESEKLEMLNDITSTTPLELIDKEKKNKRVKVSDKKIKIVDNQKNKSDDEFINIL